MSMHNKSPTTRGHYYKYFTYTGIAKHWDHDTFQIFLEIFCVFACAVIRNNCIIDTELYYDTGGMCKTLEYYIHNQINIPQILKCYKILSIIVDPIKT